MPELTDKDRELVLCVRKADVDAAFAAWEATNRPFAYLEDDEVVEEWLAEATVAFLPRRLAEHDASWRHFCTYMILRENDRVFTYRRGVSGGENRLHGLLSLGVGGHVGLDDYESTVGISARMLEAAALREVDEELNVGPKWDFGLAGLIADDSTPVNRVHVGAVYTVSVHAERVEVQDDCLAEPQWLTTAELLARRAEFESWSQICIDRLMGGAA